MALNNKYYQLLQRGYMELPKKKYKIIYADPAWSFTFWSDKAQRKVSDHYDIMSAEDIYKLPVNEIADTLRDSGVSES